MNEITLAAGAREYKINGRAILRFNPADPAMYKKFMVLVAGVEDVGKEISQRTANTTPEAMVDMLDTCDRRIKGLLSEAFGRGNDFDDIFDGCSVFASDDSGKWIITEFLDAVRGIIEAETGNSLKAKAATAHINREQRRSAQRR